MTPAEAVQTLLKVRWSERRIAKQVGSSQSTINRIRKGRDGFKPVREAVLALAEEVLAEKAVASQSPEIAISR